MLFRSKDEWEVARHHADPAFRARLEETFEGVGSLRFVMAPPLFARRDPATGRPKKTSFGPWILPLLALFARLKRVRGSLLDPFGHTAERKAERAMRDAFRADMERIAAVLEHDGGARLDVLTDLALWPREAKGYGPIKDAAMERASAKRAAILARLEAPAVTARAAE